MSKVMIDFEIFKEVLKTYFSDYYASEILDTMNDNKVFISDCNSEDFSPWIPVDVDVLKGTDIY